MSDYIGITEAQSNPFAPLTSELVKQLRDNPIAIAEGAEGAPRLRGLAAMTVAEYLSVSPLSVDVGNFEIDAEAYDGAFSSVTTTSTSFVSCGIIEAVFFSGNARFEATQTAVGGTDGGNAVSATNETRFLKNGVEIQSWSLSALVSNSTTRTVEISVSVGDTFEWQVRRSDGAVAGQTTSPSVPKGDDSVVFTSLPIKRSEQ